MEQLRLLLQKDLLLWRNSYWRTGKQAAVTLAVAAVALLAVGFFARHLLRWFSPIAETFIQGGLTVNMLSPLVSLLLVWLFVISFFSAAQLSRERFLLTPDLALLIATPVSSKIIFALRFLFMAFLSPSGFFEVALFGLAPLAALGLITAAPWPYFALLLPLIYLYRIIPAALGVTLIMLLSRALPPRRLYQALTAGNFLLGAINFYFIFGGQQALLTRLAARLAGAERILWGFPPLAATREATFLYGPLFLLPLAIAFYYRQIALFSFMHALPQPVAMAPAILLTVALATAVTWLSLRRMAAVWQGMEIK